MGEFRTSFGGLRGSRSLSTASFCVATAAGDPANGRRREDFVCRVFRGGAEVDAPVGLRELEPGVYLASCSGLPAGACRLAVRCLRPDDFIDGLRPFGVCEFRPGG